MKKLFAYILILAVIMTFSPTVFAESTENITVEFDGKTIQFDVNPEIVDGRTLVPLRKIFEEIGALVKWDSETRTVSARKSSKTITLTIGSDALNIDKGKTDDEGNPIIETVTLDVPATIISDRTLVPVRAISESFGLDVDWDEENKKVIIVSEADDDSWKENTGTINLDTLEYTGNGVEISGNQIKITSGGDYTLAGTLSDGNITVSAKEKVKLRLSGVEITSANNPCIFVEKADKAYITLTDGTVNKLIAKNSEDGAIYSKENLEIKGDGSLIVSSLAGHGMKASDNLNIENGNITIDATSDGIHINDTFKMTGGTVDITAVNDGIDSESIVNISDGVINIETNGTPIQTTPAVEENTAEPPRRGAWGADEADVEFEKSTKGINAEWMMSISGGEINVNSASHAIHCQDEIEISGGKFTLSSKYDKGISAHGNLTIGGADTYIDVVKSTEGIESKNVMTINDGTIKASSSDDAINATGGNSGMMMPGGGMGGNRVPPEGFNENQKEQIPSGTGTNVRPGRGENGQFGGARPSFENGESTPPFELGENGEFIFPEGERPQFAGNGNFQGGNMGGMGRNMKTCLVINGGYLEVCGNDDCIDVNGTMVINGGTIKAANPSGSFTGNFGVLDADGQITIGEDANIILASSNGNERSLSLTQNSIIIYCESNHVAGDKITISDNSGNKVYEYAPSGTFKAVLIASNNIKTGETCTVKIGDETHTIAVTQQRMVIGTPSSGGGFGRPQGK